MHMAVDGMQVKQVDLQKGGAKVQVNGLDLHIEWTSVQVNGVKRDSSVRFLPLFFINIKNHQVS